MRLWLGELALATGDALVAYQRPIFNDKALASRKTLAISKPPSKPSATPHRGVPDHVGAAPIKTGTRPPAPVHVSGEVVDRRDTYPATPD